MQRIPGCTAGPPQPRSQAHQRPLSPWLQRPGQASTAGLSPQRAPGAGIRAIRPHLTPVRQLAAIYLDTFSKQLLSLIEVEPMSGDSETMSCVLSKSDTIEKPKEHMISDNGRRDLLATSLSLEHRQEIDRDVDDDELSITISKLLCSRATMDA
ncbi:hypothetical protein NDU88_002501 [Pleurodeles waltl]|uniref:Uncharacterized protein n=1 Tax=Pleurodeles waltl TaxID=8319 RepID=A0AAV7MSY3_PLEWA|nr:hypothetical protein NDU88_002501 [Pleurodeles waltl]